jgi:uncharacterized protein YbjT (DUF2867 family)
MRPPPRASSVEGMTEPKTIAVVGATGATAGGLARAILTDPKGPFTCRAITRTPDSAAARALADLGATVVRADMDDVDSLVAAFDGAYGAFCMTTYWEHCSAERETAQAANQARAAAAVGVRHAIWSTMEDTRRWYPLEDDRMPTVMGRYKVPPFDAKAEGDLTFEDVSLPTTYLLTPTHWDAFVFGRGVPQPGPDGVRTLAIPLGDALLPGIAAGDIGRCAYRIFQEPEEYVGTTVGLAGEHTTGEQLAEGLARVFGERVRYQPLPLEVFRSLPFPGIEVAANMFQLIAEVPEYADRRDVAVARSLNPSLLGFDAWVEQARMKLAQPVEAR